MSYARKKKVNIAGRSIINKLCTMNVCVCVNMYREGGESFYG